MLVVVSALVKLRQDLEQGAVRPQQTRGFTIGSRWQNVAVCSIDGMVGLGFFHKPRE
jgi:hypothetical protein